MESNLTQPFIVKTNENQWQEAEGILLEMITFDDNQAVTWYRFVNAFHKLYVTSTKQDIKNPNRPLTPEDIVYIYESKFRQPNSIRLILYLY